MQGQFIAVDHDFLDGVLEFDALVPQCLGQPVDDIVEVAAVGPGAAAREDDLAHQPSVTGGVTGARDAEHAAANVDHLRGGESGRPSWASWFGGLIAAVRASRWWAGPTTPPLRPRR